MITAYLRDILKEPLPCTGCYHEQACASKKLACHAFGLYVAEGSAHEAAPRKPTRRTYARIVWFNDSGVVREANDYLKKLEAV